MSDDDDVSCNLPADEVLEIKRAMVRDAKQYIWFYYCYLCFIVCTLESCTGKKAVFVVTNEIKAG